MNFKITRLFVAALIIFGVVIVGFAISVPHTKELTVETKETETRLPPSVTLQDTYKKGVHTYTGTIVAPNACMSATAEATLQGDIPGTESILIDVFMPQDSGVCLMRETPVTFSTTLTAPDALPIKVMVNGEVAAVTKK